jgi:hypothetical protein
VRGGAGGQVAQQRGVPAGGQGRVGQVEFGGQPLGGERGTDPFQPRRVQALERLAPPQRQRPFQVGRVTRRRDESLEPVQIHGVRVDGHQVAVAATGNGVRSEQPAQPGHVPRQRVAGVPRLLVAPDPVQQPVDGHATVRVDQQRHQDAPLPRVPEIDRSPVDPHPHVTEQ